MGPLEQITADVTCGENQRGRETKKGENGGSVRKMNGDRGWKHAIESLQEVQRNDDKVTQHLKYQSKCKILGWI